jgi:hypothetical protein
VTPEKVKKKVKPYLFVSVSLGVAKILNPVLLCEWYQLNALLQVIWRRW